MVDVTSPADHGGRRNPSLRVLTFNTYVGHGLREGMRIVREFEPHIVFFQELWIHRRGNWEWRQADVVAGELRMDHVFQRHVWKGRSECGLSLMTSGRLYDVTDISDGDIRPTGLAARVELAGRSFSVAAVHLAAVPRPLLLGYPCVIPKHYRQVALALKRLEEMGGPAIMAGDFNTLPGTPAYRLACRHMVDVARKSGACASTRRTWGLPFRIDYIFASPDFHCEECRVLDSQESDHRPIIARLSLRDETPTDSQA